MRGLCGDDDDDGSHCTTTDFPCHFLLASDLVAPSSPNPLGSDPYAEKLDADPELLTSLRWLAKDSKNSLHQIVLKLTRGWVWGRGVEALHLGGVGRLARS